mgnify:CR=1 FL=1
MVKGMIKLLLLVTLAVTTYSTLLIVQPQNNGFDENKVKYGFANFGTISYGKTNSYQLKPIEKDLCTTEGLKHLDPSENNTYFLVQNTGTCSYTQQARTAQALGASGIIIGSPLFEKQKDGTVIWIDDGNGRKVHIPTLVVTPEDCTTLSGLKNISIKVSFELKKK